MDRLMRVPLDVQPHDHWFRAYAQMAVWAKDDESYESVRALLAHQEIEASERVVPHGGGPWCLVTAWNEGEISVSCFGPPKYFAAHRRGEEPS